MSNATNKQPDIASLRENYAKASLSIESLKDSPIAQFSEWMSEAIEAALPEPNALTLATVGATGFPSARVVLLKGVSEAGFTFYTNYESRKGRELAENPQAAMVFLWKELERQVRIEGLVSKISAEESDAYFNSRPLGSRLGAITSPQSEVIADRSGLKAKMEELEKLEEAKVVRPANWGGYRLAPLAIEFWQGRPSRLHDRFRFERTEMDQPWSVNRLAP